MTLINGFTSYFVTKYFSFFFIFFSIEKNNKRPLAIPYFTLWYYLKRFCSLYCLYNIFCFWILNDLTERISFGMTIHFTCFEKSWHVLHYFMSKTNKFYSYSNLNKKYKTKQKKKKIIRKSKNSYYCYF